MTETAAAETPKAKAASEAKRSKDPSYLIFQRQVDGAWMQLTKEPVKASSRKAAVLAATKDEGEFWVIPAEQFRPVKRQVRQVTVDEFA
ncbi:MAG TPA: hypothetical protein VGF95_14245 [Solirubrobacteraceae bacterium]|jgi:hypothetical protein